MFVYGLIFTYLGWWKVNTVSKVLLFYLNHIMFYIEKIIGKDVPMCSNQTHWMNGLTWKLCQVKWVKRNCKFVNSYTINQELSHLSYFSKLSTIFLINKNNG